MEDLDENPLYRAYLTRFQREFEIACRMSCIIAIPKSESLDEVLINQVLANSHILMPSKLLKMHYTPMQIGHCDDIEIEGNKMIVHLSNKKPTEKFTVNILAEEIGYNSNNKEFRTMLIDRPLIATKVRPLIRSLLSPKSSSGSKYLTLRTKPPKPLTSHDDCSRYLESISQDLTVDLETDVKRLQSHYLILSQYLDDAAMKIQSLVECYVPKYERLLGGADEGSLCNSVKNAVRLSIENYVIHLMHGKLLASIHHHHEVDDKILLSKFDELCDSRLTICQLGAQSAFANFSLSEESISESRRLPYQQSPLAMVSSLIKLVELITQSLNQSVRFRNLLGDGSCAGERISICSDDLIASLVYSLAHAKPDRLYSISRYLDTFSWSSNAREESAYYTATFQIVIQYIMSFQPDETDLTSKENPNTNSQVSRRPRNTKYSPIESNATFNQFVDSLGSRISTNTDLDSSNSSISSSLKAEWEMI